MTRADCLLPDVGHWDDRRGLTRRSLGTSLPREEGCVNLSPGNCLSRDSGDQHEASAQDLSGVSADLSSTPTEGDSRMTGGLGCCEGDFWPIQNWLELFHGNKGRTERADPGRDRTWAGEDCRCVTVVGGAAGRFAPACRRWSPMSVTLMSLRETPGGLC